MSGSSNNSWTIVTPEETGAAETLRPLTQGTERQDEPSALTDGLDAKPSVGADGPPEEDHLTSEEEVAKPKNEEVSSLPSSTPELQSGPVPDPPTEDAPQDSGPSGAEPESFSDSYTHLGPSEEETPAPPLTAETLGHLDSGQEREEEVGEQTDDQDETRHQTDRQELQPEEEETQQWSPIETPQDPTVQTSDLEAEPELRRRRLAALERIGRHDEEEEAEDDFQLPQRDEDSGITLNKCILGAVILLGLGTIFISGVFMDLDEENDFPPVELKDPESSVKQEWLNPDVSQPGADAGSAELLNKLNKGNEQIEMLQAQLQPQNEELKVAQAQAAEGSMERLEEVQKENSRLMESVPVLQKELEKMRTELESVSVLQKEVETLRSALTQLKFSAAATTPSSGRTEDSSQRPEDYEIHKREKHDKRVTKEWKDAEKSKWKKEQKQHKDGGKTEGKEKEWKKEKSERDKYDKRQKEDKRDETKEWKKDKSKRGDEGKQWKEKKDEKERTHEGDKKHKCDQFKEERSKERERDFKEGKYHQEKHKGPGDKHWKKEREDHKEEKREWINDGDKKHKHDKFEERDFKESKYHQEKHKGPGDKRWKNGRDDHKEERKEKYEKKHWKERDEYESRNRKDDDGERREKGKEQKKWKKEDKKRWVNEEEERIGEKKYQKEWRGDKFDKYDKPKSSERKDHSWTDKKPARSKPTVGQPEYWSLQKERLQHSSKPQQNCDSPDSCARTEGVRPVPFTEFEPILQNYLSKAQTAGADASHIDELRKLAAEMFQNGVFPHDKMSFQDFVEDVGDILEDLVEGEDGDEQKDGTIEEEMEGFDEEVMQTFMVSGEKDGG